ncbi:MAG: glutamyl-tRNA reductase [Planctomycetes bacterium]|nr:glutamyl-tRNA reductase [Planctomycetota bacterium]MBI3833852.1 glutamyl-tRNA reductase [Planctomycetota bacterium]
MVQSSFQYNFVNHCSNSAITPLVYIGLTHQCAPLAVREKGIPDRELQAMIFARSATMAHGRMILSTCERFECYASGTGADPEQWIDCLADWLGIPRALFSHYASVLCDDAAAAHLVRVAAGLESRILGENQILGQVREAFLLAEGQGALDATMSALARAAIRAGKRVRAETSLNAGARSIATIALDWLTGLGISFPSSSVLILGSGGLAGVVAAEIARHRPGELKIAGRNIVRCHELAQKHHATASHLSELDSQLARTNVVLACAATNGYLVGPSTLALRETSSAPMYVVDLAVPRSVDPAVRKSGDTICLVHLDDLLEGESGHRENINEAELIVRHELQRFMKWRRERAATERIRDLLGSCRTPQSRGAAGRRELHRRIERIKAEVAA